MAMTTHDTDGPGHAIGNQVNHAGDDPLMAPGKITDLYQTADGQTWAAVRWPGDNGGSFVNRHPVTELI
jgi:hypothetical protein